MPYFFFAVKKYPEKNWVFSHGLNTSLYADLFYDITVFLIFSGDILIREEESRK